MPEPTTYATVWTPSFTSQANPNPSVSIFTTIISTQHAPFVYICVSTCFASQTPFAPPQSEIGSSTSMAARLVASLLFASLLLSEVHLSACTAVVRGKVNCLDCNDNILQLSGIKIAVKCDKSEKLWTSMTEDDGFFEVSTEIQQSSTSCLAKILGGPHRMYASKKTMVSRVVKEGSSYTTSTPLGMYSSCPEDSCSREESLGSSKTVNFPLPVEWGLAPSSYYFPFVPIIGIP